MQPVSQTVTPPVTQAGFADPARDAQASFRVLLGALAEPGQVRGIDLRFDPPAPLGRALAAACLTLLDFETPVWLAPGIGRAAADWIVFHTGAPLAAVPGEAAFAVIADPAELGALDRFSLGSDEAPEGGATVLLQVPALAEGEGPRWTGPGIETSRRLAVTGVNKAFWQGRAALQPLFPRGIDIFLCAGDRLAGLPRTTTVEA